MRNSMKAFALFMSAFLLCILCGCGTKNTAPSDSVQASEEKTGNAAAYADEVQPKAETNTENIGFEPNSNSESASVQAPTPTPEPTPTPTPTPTPEPEINLAGVMYYGTETELNLSETEITAEELAEFGELFPNLTLLDLSGKTLTPDEILLLRNAFSGAPVLCTTEYGGLIFNTDITELDFTDSKLNTAEDVELLLRILPNLRQLIMPPYCGIADETLDALNIKYPNCRIIWTVHFGNYSLRTDATMFCASHIAGWVAQKLTDEQISPIRYCTDLVALDLGHMYYSDLSFLENMTHLKYLILVEACYSDISVLSNLSELYYLELFNNKIDDLSPLLSCTNLRHLNVGYVRGCDYSPLLQMTWLKRLWYPGGEFTAEQRDAIAAALTDTECYGPSYDSAGSTGGGWRENDAYYEMRDVFSMFYQPGGTGTNTTTE